MEDLNKEPINSVSSNADLEKKEERKKEDLTDEKFLVEAEKVVNRIIQQYDKLLELSKKHHVEDKDANFMFNELKKVHDSTKKTFKEYLVQAKNYEQIEKFKEIIAGSYTLTGGAMNSGESEVTSTLTIRSK